MVMAMLIDRGIETGDMHNILFYGAILLVMAVVALVLRRPQRPLRRPGVHGLCPQPAPGNV